MKTQERLKQLMIRKGISAPQLAKLTGINEQRIIAFFDGRNVLNLIQQAKVIGALGYTEPVKEPRARSTRRIQPKWLK